MVPEEDAFEECAYVGFLVGASVVGAEDEAVRGDAERDGEVAQHIECWCAGAGFVATDLGDVDPDAIRELLLDEAAFLAGGCEAGGEVHGEALEEGWVDHTWGLFRVLDMAES